MPSPNLLRYDSPDSYYHVYARGNAKQTIFLGPQDYAYFLKLIERYLSKKPAQSKLGYIYPHYAEQLELLTYCLMPNHFHFLFYQKDEKALSGLMKSLMTSYSLYFNLRYRRTGHVFESRYKASRISNQEYLEHISRYIHLNPRYWKRYPYSSLVFYKEAASPPEWLRPQRIIGLFKNTKEYWSFLSDYEAHKKMLDEIKHELAGR